MAARNMEGLVGCVQLAMHCFSSQRLELGAELGSRLLLPFSAMVLKALRLVVQRHSAVAATLAVAVGQPARAEAQQCAESCS